MVILKYLGLAKLGLSEQEILNDIESLMTDAVDLRMVSDVPVGVFLSGGYDSSLVTALLSKNKDRKLHTYTIGFNEKKYNEAVVYLQRAAGGLPGRARIQYNLGLLLQYLKKDKEAEQLLLKAVLLDPGSFDFLFALADHYIKRNQPRNAALVADKMIELFPENKTGYDILKYAATMKLKNSKAKE